MSEVIKSGFCDSCGISGGDGNAGHGAGGGSTHCDHADERVRYMLFYLPLIHHV